MILSSYVKSYTEDLNHALQTIDDSAVDRFYDSFCVASHNNTFIFGNGGSAAIADHFCADINKGVYTDTLGRIRCTSLVSNAPVLTAYANDVGYDHVFSKQIEMLYREDHPDHDGIAIAVSSSGNSPNVLNGLETANQLGIQTVALVGFAGGIIKRDNLADIIIHVEWYNYGIVEDAHMLILHALAQRYRLDHSSSSVKL